MTWEVALRELAPRVLRYCVGYLGDRSLGEEVAQESLAALVAAWRRWGPPLNPDRIVVESAMGKASTAKMTALRAQKLAELNARNQELESARQKLASGSLLSDAAGATAQKSIDRLQVDLQRAQQDTEAAVQELQQQINADFDRALTPVVEQVARDKGLYILLRVDTGTIAWADPSLDITGDIIKRLDATTASAEVKPPKPTDRR